MKFLKRSLQRDREIGLINDRRGCRFERCHTSRIASDGLTRLLTFFRYFAVFSPILPYPSHRSQPHRKDRQTPAALSVCVSTEPSHPRPTPPQSSHPRVDVLPALIAIRRLNRA